MPVLQRISASEIEVLFTTVFTGSEEAALQCIHQRFSPSYVQVTDGKSSTFDEFVAHIKKLRSLVRAMSVEVVYVVQEGNKLADRHIIRLEKIDGTKAMLEVLLLSERDDEGRFLRVWETARTLEGEEGSSELARVV